MSFILPTESNAALARTEAYRLRLTTDAKLRQRWLLMGAGFAYAIISLWVAFRVGAPPIYGATALQLIGVTLVLFGFTFARTPGPFLEFNPALITLAVGAHIMLGAAVTPDHAALRSAFVFSVLMFFAVGIAPTLRSAVGALSTAALTMAAGAFYVLPANASRFAGLEAMAYMVPALIVAVIAALYLEHERHAAFALRTELERRATSDEMTGVSNRAHITLLAQNEFARARRYKEPYACLYIEIDHYEALASYGPRATEVVVQVFTGYCVVVMRHCDSFGRLTPSRFLALLPETQGIGANILAQRMCRDLANLEVQVDGAAVHFTVSIGAAELDITDRWAADLLRRAEQALEDAIERGRGMAVFGTPHRPLFETTDDDASA